MPAHTPPADIQIGPALTRRLLAAQHPDLAALPLGPPEEGWDNVTLRLGPDMALRLPRRQIAAELIRHEQIWLPRLAPALPIPAPVPLRLGAPTEFFPWHWSVLPWFDGTTADQDAPTPDQAPALADFLSALHRPAPAKAPFNPFRAKPLAARDAQTRARFDAIAARGDWLTPPLLALWNRAISVPVPEARLWIHGDLHARNVQVREGRIAAILDWGDLTAGDPATDLATFWLIFDGKAARREGFARYGADASVTLRAMGWALAMAVIHLDTGLGDHPVHARIGAATLAWLAEDLTEDRAPSTSDL